MPRKTLYILSVISVIGFALGLIFTPELFWGFYGAAVDPMSVGISRLMTGTMVANIFLFWMLKDAPASSKEAKLFSQSQVIAWGLTGVYVTLMVLTLGLNALGWGTVVLSAAFAILFAMDGFKT